MKNIELLEPHSGSEADVEVPAGTSDIVLYRIVDKPASLSFIVSPRFKKSPEALKILALNKGKRTARLSPEGEDIGIAVYAYRTQDGLINFYQNSSKSFRLEEQGDFQLENCKILSSNNDSKLKLELNPGEENLLQIMRYDEAPYFKINVTGVKYRVVPV